jgi:hypothetical protein
MNEDGVISGAVWSCWSVGIYIMCVGGTTGPDCGCAGAVVMGLGVSRRDVIIL